MLDMLQGGPKLRRWYGEQEMLGVGGPKYDDEEYYGSGLEGSQPQDDSPKDTVLVLDGDSAMGEQLVLQLILARQKVRALVGDPVMARQAFGPYVDFVQGSASAMGDAAGALKGVQTLIATGKLDAECVRAAKRAGVERLLLLSSLGLETGGLSLGFLLGSEDAVLKDARREAVAASSGLPFTVVRVGAIQDVPGGSSDLSLQSDAPPTGKISREDVARVLSAAVSKQPPSAGVILTVGSQSSNTSGASWQQQLNSLMESSPAS